MTLSLRRAAEALRQEGAGTSRQAEYFALADELEAMGKDKVLVPKSATDAMIMVGVKSLHGNAVYKCVSQEGIATMEDDISMAYSAMLAAVSEATARKE